MLRRDGLLAQGRTAPWLARQICACASAGKKERRRRPGVLRAAPWGLYIGYKLEQFYLGWRCGTKKQKEKGRREAADWWRRRALHAVLGWARGRPGKAGGGSWAGAGWAGGTGAGAGSGEAGESWLLGRSAWPNLFFF
jgi:hypothetical protein